MKKLIFVLTIILFLQGVMALSVKSCSDTNTLNITTVKDITTTDGTETLITMEYKTCQNGCANGECKNNKIGMPVDIYIFFCGLAVVTMFVSVFKNDALFLKWISFALFILVGISSFSITRTFCEYSGTWECYNTYHTIPNVGYLWIGMSVIMFVYAFLASILQPANEIQKEINS
jgi:hypothetical protein